MIRRIARLGLVIASLAVFLVGTAGAVSAHGANATLTCAEGGVTLHIEGNSYPAGSTITYSVDGGPGTTVPVANYDIDAGSPTKAHTADVQFTTSDGQTQYDYHFALTSEACVEGSEAPSSAPSAAPSSDASEAPASSAPSASPTSGVEGATGRPAATPPPTDAAGAMASPADDGWQVLVILMVGAAIAIGLATAARVASRSR